MPRSLLLLSDGFQNTDPTVATILPTVPAGVLVHTVALGLASDQVLLQHIADDTGGTYFFSPDELGLFEIYNVAHAALADTDLMLNDTISFPSGDSGFQARSFSRTVVIDCDADYADFSVAAHQSDVCLSATLRCLSLPFADLSRLERKTGPGYLVMRLKRPQPGVYELRVDATSAGPVTCAVAGYLKSPLRLRLGKLKGRQRLGRPIDLPFAILDKGRPFQQLSVSADVLCPVTSIALLAKQWKRNMSLTSEPLDQAEKQRARAQAVREHLRLTTGQDPLQFVRKRIQLVHPKLARDSNVSALLRVPQLESIDGTYNVRFVARGKTGSGCPFVRVGFRSLRVS